VRPFKKGVAILAEKAGVNIQPAFIAGSEKAWGYGKAPRPHPVWVIFGKNRSPEELEALANGGASDKHQAISTGLREEVLALRQELESILAGR
jgi:1-acyl-sn-glycerol-3-phosphate acyltransferase